MVRPLQVPRSEREADLGHRPAPLLSARTGVVQQDRRRRRPRLTRRLTADRRPVTEDCFYHLEAPVLRVGGYNVPYPLSRLEEDFLPDLDRVLDSVDRPLH